MQFALVDGVRCEAFLAGRGVCPQCGRAAIAKCGPRIIHHWAHEGRRNCDPWWENETKWHRYWKSQFPKDWLEISHMAADGEIHYKVDVEGLGQFGAVGAPGMAGSTRELVIRPHRLRVGTEQGATDAIPGIIERISYTGDALSVGVRVADRTLNAQLLTSSGKLPRLGDAAYLSWDAQDAYLLPEALLPEASESSAS